MQIQLYPHYKNNIHLSLDSFQPSNHMATFSYSILFLKRNIDLGFLFLRFLHYFAFYKVPTKLSYKDTKRLSHAIGIL